jgi:hypothetical protein
MFEGLDRLASACYIYTMKNERNNGERQMDDLPVGVSVFNENINPSSKCESYRYHRIKMINSHAGYSRLLAECDDLPAESAFIPSPRDIKSPYEFSASTIIMDWSGKQIFVKETSHKHYEVWELDSGLLMSDDDATEIYIHARKAA